jgi:hypothetical protein
MNQNNIKKSLKYRKDVVNYEHDLKKLTTDVEYDIRKLTKDLYGHISKTSLKEKRR